MFAMAEGVGAEAIHIRRRRYWLRVARIATTGTRLDRLRRAYIREVQRLALADEKPLGGAREGLLLGLEEGSVRGGKNRPAPGDRSPDATGYRDAEILLITAAASLADKAGLAQAGRGGIAPLYMRGAAAEEGGRVGTDDVLRLHDLGCRSVGDRMAALGPSADIALFVWLWAERGSLELPGDGLPRWLQILAALPDVPSSVIDALGDLRAARLRSREASGG